MKPKSLKTDLSSFDNSWYDPGSALKRTLWYVISYLFFEQPWNVLYNSKCFWLRAFGAQVGKGVVIKPSVKIKYPWNLRIGHHCWIGERVWIDNLDMVTFGDHVCISQSALLICGNHNYKSIHFDLMIAPIVLKDGSWVGAKSIVGPGVTVHSHAVLCLGSVATKDLEAYGIYAGNPAKFMKTRVINEP